VIPEGYVRPAGESLLSPNVASVTPGYFEAMRVGLVRGRLFDAGDRADTLPVAIVDERLAATFWPGTSAIGRRMYQPQSAERALSPGPDTRFVTVVGVVRTVELEGPGAGEAAVGAYYFPMAQAPTRAFTVVVRSSADPHSLVAPLRNSVRSLDSNLPLFGIEAMTARVDASLQGRRVPMLLSLVFGAVALLLAAVGVYGVLACRVAERRREIGIRLALGSTAAEVFRLVLADGARILLAGLAAGLTAALLAARAMAIVLYGVEPTDGGVIATVAVVLSAVALVATVLPARRAALVSPSVALTD
jgi:hypothetical protein